MKSIKILAMAGAVALLGTAGLSSCKTNNGPEGPGKYDGQVVKTDLLIHISEKVDGANSSSLRMPAKTVQSEGNFRGMKSMVLVPLDSTATPTSYLRNGKNISLTPDIAANGLIANSNSKYFSVAIPLGTKKFRFYAEALDAPTDDAGWHQYGCVTRTNLDDNHLDADIKFKLKPIYTGGNNSVAVDLVAYLNAIASANSHTGAGDPADNEKWANHSNEGIKQLYTDFCGLTAGSSQSIEDAVEDLYNTLQRYQSTQVDPDPIVAAVIAAIATGTNGEGGSLTGSAIPYTLVLKNSLKGYPANINLPEGAATVSCTAGTFEVGTSGSVVAGGLGKYVYPASLQYYAESKIKTSTTSRANDYDGTNSWATILGNYDNNGTVKANTKSVAIVDPINYAVGQLQTTVCRQSGTLKDQKNNDITISSPLKLKGILVGNQKAVDYKFEQIESESDVFTIYDKLYTLDAQDNVVAQPFEVIPVSPSTTPVNYTLVFSTKDNYANSTIGDDQVRIAIEVENTNGDFYGQGGQLIPAGATFYLVGVLNAKTPGTGNTVDDAKHPAKYNIFYKDYITKVNFTIKSLANAYNTIPDLRSEDLELGFSVDLSWQEGLIFNISL